jgi:hypothetical protein
MAGHGFSFMMKDEGYTMKDELGKPTPLSFVVYSSFIINPLSLPRLLRLQEP